MTRANLVLSLMVFVLLFLIGVLATAHVPQPPKVGLSPAHFRFPLIPAFTLAISPAAEGKGCVLVVGTPDDTGKIPPGHFSSRADALAAEKLLREALMWADPTVRVMSPAPVP